MTDGGQMIIDGGWVDDKLRVRCDGSLKHDWSTNSGCSLRLQGFRPAVDSWNSYRRVTHNPPLPPPTIHLSPSQRPATNSCWRRCGRRNAVVLGRHQEACQQSAASGPGPGPHVGPLQDRFGLNPGPHVDRSRTRLV